MVLEEEKKKLVNVLEYTAELLKIGARIVSDVTATKNPYFFEESLEGLEGVRLAPDANTYMSIRRLKENPPPEPPEDFADWVEIGPRFSPDKIPELPIEKWIRVDLDMASELVDAGIIEDPEQHIQRPVDRDAEPDTVDVLLQVARMPELVAEWRKWVEGEFARWAEIERPRRRSIAFYNRVYKIDQQMKFAGSEAPVEIVWGVGVARWQHPSARVNAPLLEQLVEIELSDATGMLSIRPRGVPPRLNLSCVSGLNILNLQKVQTDLGASFAATVADPDMGFSPFELGSYSNTLQACATRLCERGTFVGTEIAEGRVSLEQSRKLPPIGEDLCISDSWVIWVRVRDESSQVQDIERLIRKVEGVDTVSQIPPTGRRIVTPPDDTRTGDDESGIDLTDTRISSVWGADSASGGSGGGFEAASSKSSVELAGIGTAVALDGKATYFPLPFNDEQIRIVRKLEEHDGVLVQGPPGTGKTHTIGNIIAHYMATGRRVLVTARTAEALAAVREKLPEEIREMVIATIHNDAEGRQQLQAAIHLLADKAKNIDRRVSEREIADLTGKIAQTVERMQEIDKALFAYAKVNLEKRAYRGEELMPVDLAKVLAADRHRHLWLADSLVEARERLDILDSEMAELVDLRRRIGPDTGYDPDRLIRSMDLPNLPLVLSAHEGLKRIQATAKGDDGKDLPVMDITAIPRTTAVEARSPGQAFSDELRSFAEFRKACLANPLHEMYWQVRTRKLRLDLARADAFEKMTETWIALAKDGAPLCLLGIELPESPDAGLQKAIVDQSEGRKAFGLIGGLLGGQLKAKLALIRIEGRAPATADEWRQIRCFMIWRTEFTALVARVRTLIPNFRGDGRAVEMASVEPLVATHGEFVAAGTLLGEVQSRVREIDAYRETLRRVFPYRIDVDAMIAQGECALAIETLDKNLERIGLADAEVLRGKLTDMAKGADDPLHQKLAGIASGLGDRKITGRQLADAWSEFASEVVRVEALEEALRRKKEIVDRIKKAGASEWAKKLNAPYEDGIEVVPMHWRETWEWARANVFLSSIADMTKVRYLADSRLDVEANQRRLFLEIIRARTYLGLKNRLTNKVEVALQQFITAIAKIGQGKGSSAKLQTQLGVLRVASAAIAPAIPCWVMPEWRVAEQLPPELGLFDLVIVDEASQSDITTLPILLRAKKVLIVGDDQQVTPTPIGIEERRVAQLREAFLSDLPFAAQMDPATSLYDLGGMLFPGRALLLREHFRCVEPIIAYSSRLYPEPLVPLRLPPASERLEPPLIDIYVPHGSKNGEENEAEAEVILDEIGEIIEDETMSKRSIGVISLIGARQAQAIYEGILDRYGPEIVDRHKIMCGNSATFQGQERDIVFLSMVSCSRTSRALTSSIFRQRFNVAMSRARDRVVLVRSVRASELREHDLKRGIVEHFRKPMEDVNIGQARDVLDVCDSDFEREFGARMIELGYRLRPQVAVGAFRIDFVIEGDGAARLAVELDGDQFHGPDRWLADFQRQKALERVGWRFWRCWGSSWAADREGCIEDLIRTLRRLGIEPIGAAQIEAVYTLHKTIERELPDVGSVAAGGPPDAIVPVSVAGSIEIGDTVIFHYVDEKPKRQHRILVVPEGIRTMAGQASADAPLGRALLGTNLDDEIEVELPEGRRTIAIERIEKLAEAAE